MGILRRYKIIAMAPLIKRILQQLKQGNGKLRHRKATRQKKEYPGLTFQTLHRFYFIVIAL
jgi:hypothetical protein